MAVSWGSTWYQVVHKELDLNGIICLDRYPSSCGSYNEGKEVTSVIIPNLDGFVFVEAKSKADAQFKVKRHKLDVAREGISLLTYMIEDRTLEADLLRFDFNYNPDLSDTQRSDICHKMDLLTKCNKEDKEKLSALKKARRSKVVEFLESELKAIVTKQNSQ